MARLKRQCCENENVSNLQSKCPVGLKVSEEGFSKS